MPENTPDPSRPTLVHLKRLSRPAGEPGARAPQRPPLLVLLHGLGANEADLFEHAAAFDPRFVVLSVRAPLVWGPESYAWFTARFTDDGPRINPVELRASRDRVAQFLGQAAAAYDADPSRVYLYGFSQGAILAFTLALTLPRLLAGAVACAGRIPPEVLPWAAPPDETAGLPILLQHGRADATLPLEWAQRARLLLEAQRVALDYREYDAGHTITAGMLEDASFWLTTHLDTPAPWDGA
jgi:phospholipase/carboxylesterase